jgi:hypothetical protein
MSKLIKGSPAAKAWGKKMQRLRRKNPGAAWHEREAGHAHTYVRGTTDPDEKLFYAGVESAHRISASAATNMKMNPDGVGTYIEQEGWKPLGKKNVLAFSRTKGSLFQILQKEARAWRVLYRTFLTAAASPALSLGTYDTLDKALIAANRQANEWAGQHNPKGFHNIEKSGFHRGEYVGYGGGVWRIVKYGTGWNAGRQGEPRAYFTAPSLAAVSAKLAEYAAQKNPKGARSVPERHQLKIALDTLKMPDAMVGVMGGPNKEEAREIIQRLTGKAPKKNPITIVGNPKGQIPSGINTDVAGVLYTVCHEIRAEKTQSGRNNGLYYHPFARSSKVCILALDSGDLLIHSLSGSKLWREL